MRLRERIRQAWRSLIRTKKPESPHTAPDLSHKEEVEMLLKNFGDFVSQEIIRSQIAAQQQSGVSMPVEPGTVRTTADPTAEGTSKVSAASPQITASGRQEFVDGREYRWDRNGRLRQYHDHQALERIQAERLNVPGNGCYDPQADEPLDPHNEQAMEQMGPAAFLSWLCKNYNKSVSPIPKTDHECARSARIVMRSIKDYFGERYIQ